MKIILVRGRGPVSRLIQFQTRSPYSHAAVMLDSGVVYEAKEFVGVRKLTSLAELLEQLKAGTQVEVYDYPVYLEEAVEAFLESAVGCRYDYRAVLRFVTRVPAEQNGKWFCSELVSRASELGERRLLRGEHHNHSPRDLALSPALKADPDEVFKA